MSDRGVASRSAGARARILVDCGRAPVTEWAVPLLIGAGWLAIAVGLAFVVPPPVGPIAVVSALLTLGGIGWFLRRAPTLITEDGVHAPNASVSWGDLVGWEMYDRGRLLSLTTRSDLLRIDHLTVDVRLYQNQDAAIAVLRERVPNGRVLPWPRGMLEGARY